MAKKRLTKTEKGLCSTPHCRNARPNKGRVCPKCTARKIRREDPERAQFHQNKRNAKGRGKEWTIELDNFRDWCKFHNYIELKGIYKKSMHIDRKQNEYGYHIWNIQPLTNSENIKKENYLRKLRKQKGIEAKAAENWRSELNVNDSDYVPF